jgi:hypothetical protein
MIQRIQSIYLLLAALCGIILFFVPIYVLVPGVTAIDAASYKFSLLSVDAILNNVSTFQMRFWPLIVTNSFFIIASLATIFRYNNRKVQIKFCSFLTLIQVLLIVLLAYDTEQLRITIGPGHILNFSLAAILVVLPVLFIRLAGRAIKKDDDLVRSADRLR